MARISTIVVLAAILFVFAGCSSSRYAYREQAWRKDFEAICMAKTPIRRTSYAEPISRINDRGVCGVWQPIRVSAALRGYVGFSTPATLTCPMTHAVDGWMYHSVQPAAVQYLGAYVTGIRNMGSYACRTRNHKVGAKMSEHAFGNALDIGSFTLSDGRTISVLNDWNGSDPAARAFLREVHKGACGMFTTVLGPNADAAHRDHFHVDLARHNADNSYRYCR